MFSLRCKPFQSTVIRLMDFIARPYVLFVSPANDL